MAMRYGLIVGMLGLLTVVMLPTIADPLGSHPRGARLVDGWLPYWTNQIGHDSGWKDVVDNAGQLDSVSFFAYNVDPATGSLAPPAKGMDESSLVTEVGWLHSREVQALLTITLFGKVHDFLASTTAPPELIDNIVATTDSLGMDGVDIDFEDFKDDDVADSTRFRQFVDSLGERMHAERDAAMFPKTVCVTILARTTRGKFVFTDESELAESNADRVRVMAYDDYYPGSKKAGADAPLPWDQNVAAYLHGLDGAQEWKFEFGIPGYGYRWPIKSESDWTTVGKGLSETYAKARELILSQKARQIWDSSSQTPQFEYVDGGQPWIGWYEDQRSWQAKVEAVLKPTRLAGLSEWALGFEDPAVWPMLNRELTPTHPIYGVIGDCYARFGGGARFGDAVTDVIPAGGEDTSTLNNRRGIEQDFRFARFYYRWGDARAYVLTDTAANQYVNAGGPSGPLGFPVADAIQGSATVACERGSIPIRAVE